MNLETATAHLMKPTLGAEVRAALSNYPGTDDETLTRTVDWVLQTRDELIALLTEIDDEEQIPQSLAIYYIELKSRWIALNTKVNFQMFRLGSCEVESAIRGTAISMLLAEVESMLEQSDIQQITDFLAQPLRRAA
jgi:hypothetical protein